MSSRSADLHENNTSDAKTLHIQRKRASMQRRVDARESALSSALAHARAIEALLRRQLDEERRRHAIESGLLRERIRRLEQCLLGYAATMRASVKAPLQALRDGSRSLGLGTQSSARIALTPAPAERAAVTAPTPAPFDPAAIVASMLPLDESQAEAGETNTAAALERLRTILNGPSPEGDRSTELAPTLTPAIPPAPHIDPPRQDAQDDVAVPARERIAGSDTPWFPRALRRLVEEDPQSAGRLLLQLLPVQGLVWPEDIAYRIDVLETGALAVQTSGGRGTVQPLLDADAPNPSEPTLRTDLAGLARAVVGRRGLGRVGARIAGSRNRHLRPLRALAGAPLALRDLQRAGVQPDPTLLLRLLALAIDPHWTANEVFTISCRWRGRAGGGCYVHVFENAPVAVTSNPPLGRVAAILTCDPHELLDVLLGDMDLNESSIQIGGDRAAVKRLLNWVRRVDATAMTRPAAETGGHVLEPMR